MSFCCFVYRGAISVAFLFMLSPALAEEAGPINPAPGCAAPAKRMQRLELLFGLSGKTSAISSRAWERFIDREVTPRFPDGLSVFEGYGQWRDSHGAINKERSKLLLIWYAPDAASDAKIEAIRAAYKRRFHQESVLRSDETSCVSF